jgi:hypothetical protein
MTRTAAEVEADVEASRNELDRNVDALRQKMTPGQLFDEAARMMGGTGQQVASKFAEQAKANPMPLAVMGLGLAWLMVSNNRSGGRLDNSRAALGEPRSFMSDVSYDGGLSDQDGSAGEGLKAKAEAIGDKAHDMLSTAQQKIASARSSASESGRSAVQGLTSAAGTVRDTAGQLGHQAQRSFIDSLQSEPLLIAGLGLVVGAAIGAALPGTEAENRMMGETRNRILEKGKDLAQTGLEKASDAAQATYGAVKSELQSGDEAAEPSERLTDAARSGVEAAKSTLQGPAH